MARRAVTPLSLFDGRPQVAGNTDDKDKDKGPQLEVPDAEKPKPRRKTVMRLMAQGERAKKKEDAAQKVREDSEPLCEFISIETIQELKEVTDSLAKQIPQNVGAMRMARLRAPKSSTGAALRDGATVDQAATHAALKALEKWVRILRPFASSGQNESEDLGILIAKIVHVKDDGRERERLEPLTCIPPVHDPLGAAIRRIVPDPDILHFRHWEWIDDLLHALSFEESFDRNSFVHRSSSASGGMRKTRSTTVLEPIRPGTTGRIPTDQSKSETEKLMRLSGDWAWDSFHNSDGFRVCKSTFSSDKYLRSTPGPAVYIDYHKNFAKPHNPALGVYPSVGDRRTVCITTPLVQLDRFFHQNYRLE